MALQLKKRRWLECSLLLVLHLSAAHSAIRRVPGEYSTIQAALDALEQRDTVLVDTGVYVEALVAPPISFVLLGNTASDTGSYSRPVVDPTALTGSDTLKCLHLPGGDSVIVRDFVFHNGAAMSRPDYTVGGIENQAGMLIATRCHWDSVYYGIRSVGHPIVLEECVFTECFRFLVHAGSAAIHATDVIFQGHSEWSLLQCGGHSAFTRCSIANSPGDAHLAIVVGTDVSFAECVIGPSHGGLNHAIQGSLRNSLFQDNLFVGNVLGSALVHNSSQCDSPVVFRDNIFLSNQAETDSLSVLPYMLSAACSDTFSQCNILVADGNVFSSSASNAITTNGRDLAMNNRLRELSGGGPAVMVVWRSLRLRNNTFDGTGTAAYAEYEATMDAEWDWWGDRTGPYHAVENPGGQGDTIVGNVDFIPWHTDTSFLYSPEPRVPLPQEVMLEVYPNPFNATATVKLRVTKPGIFQVDLYNTLGRHVRRLWSGAVADERVLAVDGAGLASGLYFVRVWQPIENQPVAMEKLVIMK